MTSTTPSELVLTDNEFGLFELMRDGVVLGLWSGGDLWRCQIVFHNEQIQNFDSRLGALDAFMQARVAVVTAKIQGQQIYTDRALKKRKELGLP